MVTSSPTRSLWLVAALSMVGSINSFAILKDRQSDHCHCSPIVETLWETGNANQFHFVSPNYFQPQITLWLTDAPCAHLKHSQDPFFGSLCWLHNDNDPCLILQGCQSSHTIYLPPYYKSYYYFRGLFGANTFNFIILCHWHPHPHLTQWNVYMYRCIVEELLYRY